MTWPRRILACYAPGCTQTANAPLVLIAPVPACPVHGYAMMMVQVTPVVVPTRRVEADTRTRILKGTTWTFGRADGGS